MKFARPLAMLPLLALLAGCGAHSMPGAAVAKTASTAAAKAVSPDDPAVLAEDQRRATYWADQFGGDATLVMAVQTTALNTQKVSAAGNVFFCKEAWLGSKPCVFVARHYFTKAIAQYTQMADYNSVAKGLAPIGDYTVKAASAWTLAHSWTPAANGGTNTMSIAGKQFFTSSRANLIMNNGQPVWMLYADSQKFTIDANSGQVTPPEKALNPDDMLNTSGDVNLQRASAVWMPTNPLQVNQQVAPS